MEKLQLGINNCFAVKRWPEPDIWAKIVKDELKVDHVQFSFDLLDPLIPEPTRFQSCAEIKEAADRRGIFIDTSFSGLTAYISNLLMHPDVGIRNHGIRWYEEAIRISSWLGTWGTGGYMGSMSIKDFQNENRRKLIIDILLDAVAHLSKLCASHGQRVLLWEMMPSRLEVPHSIDEARDLLTQANLESPVPVGLCFDLGHCCASDLEDAVNIYEWLGELLPWIYVVHLQQTDGKGDHHWPFTPDFNRVGCIEPKEVLDVVSSSPLPHVDLVLEIFHPSEAPDSVVLNDLKASVETFAELL